ncbi:hypothetical protein ACOMHN_006771 [Nucella lapillus]
MSGYGRSGGGSSRSRGGDDFGEESSDEMFVPARDCGKIIGRGGGKIRDLQDQSKCRIKVCRDDEGDGTRRVELSGSDYAIDLAKELITQLLEAGDDRGPPRQQQQQSYGSGGGGGAGGAGSSKEVMQVDSSFVGRIIGKGGSRVRELQEDTGCRINVSRDGGNYGHTDIELIGTSGQIQRAKDAIDDLVNQSY